MGFRQTQVLCENLLLSGGFQVEKDIQLFLWVASFLQGNNSSIDIFYMEYQLKKEQLLSTVEYTNLLSFNLVQNKLERNFKSIVEALLLNQTKTDDLQTKTETLQDRLSAEAKKNVNDFEGIRQILKQFDNRISQFENRPISEARSSEEKTSSGVIKQTEKESKSHEKQQSEKSNSFKKQSVNLREPPIFIDKSSIYDKKIEELDQQLAAIKDKLPSIQIMESQLDSMKRQFTVLKGEFITFNNRSNKALKRESIQTNLNAPSNQMNPITNMGGITPNGSNHNIRRDSMKRGSTLVHSNSSAVLTNDLSNKENKDIVKENRDSKAKEEGDGSMNKMEGGEGIYQSNDYDKEIEGLHVEVNTLNICYEELKLLVEDLRKRDIKHHSHLSDLDSKNKKIQEQMRKGFEDLEKQFKMMQVEMLNASNQIQEVQVSKEGESAQTHSPKAERARSPAMGRDENTINWKNQLNDRISKIQASLQGFVTETEFNRFKQQTRDKSEDLEKKHEKLQREFEEQIKKIYDMLINKDLDINRLGELITSTQEIIKENNTQADRKHNIAIARIEQLKKNLQNLREDVEFYQSMNADKKTTNEPEKGEGQGNQIGKAVQENMVQTKAIEDLKRYFNNKMHDQRAYLIGLVRDLEKKMNASSGFGQEIANVWDKINELGLFMGRKADADDVKKNLIFLEKKISRLGAQFMKSDDNTEDARIAKTSWFCLSCDKNLLGYQGKIGRHVIWDQMPLKGLVKTTIEKKGLPSLKGK